MKIPVRKNKIDGMLDPFELDIIQNSKKGDMQISDVTHILLLKSLRQMTPGLYDFDPGNMFLSRGGEPIGRLGTSEPGVILRSNWGEIYSHPMTLKNREEYFERKKKEKGLDESPF